MLSRSSQKEHSPPPSSSADESSSDLESQDAVPREGTSTQIRDPLWSLRRTNAIVGLLGGGCLSIGSCLVIALYVTGPPRLGDLATSVTAILFLALVGGCAACIPSWVGAAIILFGAKPKPDSFPPHAKLLRLLYLIATLIATIYGILALVLYVLLQEKESFVDFCILNHSNASEESCTTRWNRNWLIILGVGLVLLYHIAFGFPLYRYTRGPQGGTELKEGYLLEMSHREEGAEERRRWSFGSDGSGDESDGRDRASLRRHRERLEKEKRRERDEEW